MELSEKKAINAKQLKVTFNKTIDADTVLTSGTNVIKNINIAASSATSSTSTAVVDSTATGSLSKDGRTLTITLATATVGTNVFDGTYVLTTNKDVLTTSKENVADYSGTFSLSDKVAPTISSVTSTTNGSIATSATVSFNEPITTAVVKIDGEVATVSSGSGTDTWTFNGLSLKASETHKVEILNATDYEGNVTALETKTFNVSTDTVAPKAVLEAAGDHAFYITFDKAVNPSTVTTSNITVAGENLAAVAKSVSTVGTSNKKFLVTITDSLYTTTQKSRTLTVQLAEGIKDSLGNKLATTTTTVALAKDEVAPTIESVKSVNDTDGNAKALVINFSEAISGKPADLSDVSAKDATTGETVADVTTLLNSTNTTWTLSDDGKTLTIPVLSAVRGEKYNFVFAKGFATDNAQTANDSVAKAATVSFDSAVSAFALTQAAVTSVPATNTVTIVYPKAIVGDFSAKSANNPANYTVAGKALPADADIEVTQATNTVVITLPSDFVAKTDSNAVFTVNNVTAKDGSVLTPFVGAVNVKDNTTPKLTNVKWNTNGSFNLVFSEAVTGAAEAGVEVYLNGGKTAINPAAYTFAAGTGSDEGQIVVTFNTVNDATVGKYVDVNNDSAYTAGTDVLFGDISSVTAKVVTGTDIADAATNTAELNLSASATK